LLYEEAGPRLGRKGPIVISGDSKYVSVPGGTGSGPLANHPAISIYGSYIYAVTDLLAPVIAIKTGAYPKTLAFDQIAARVYGQNKKSQLIVFDANGAKEREFTFGSGDDEVRQILVHPEGRKVLILTERSLVWIKLN